MNITIFAGYRSAGFLAYLTSNTEAPTGTDPILFDTEAYDYGDNYNPSTGKYTVPYNGTYLIHARVYGWDNYASHNIMVDGDDVAYTKEYDNDEMAQASSTSIVLHLVAEQAVTVDPEFTGTIRGALTYMGTSFGATMLYRD